MTIIGQDSGPIMTGRSKLDGLLKSGRRNVIDSDEDDFEYSPPSKPSNITTERTSAALLPQQTDRSIVNRASASVLKRRSPLNLQPNPSLNQFLVRKTDTAPSSSSATATATAAPKASSWTCGICTYCNVTSRLDCEMCGAMRSSADLIDTWICSSCTLVNEDHRRACSACGQSKHIKESLDETKPSSSSSAVKSVASSSSNGFNAKSSLSSSSLPVSISKASIPVKHRTIEQIDSDDDFLQPSTLSTKKPVGLPRKHQVVDLVDENLDEDSFESDMNDDGDDDDRHDGSGSDNTSTNDDDDEDSYGHEWSGSDDIETYSDEGLDITNISAIKGHRHISDRSKASRTNHATEINQPTIQTAQPSTAFLNPSYPHLSQHFR
jgi:hypothetical protein